MDVPNLDAMDEADLRVFARQASYLAAYARRQAVARRYRAMGRIQDAMRIEAECEKILNQLPLGWRW